MTRPWALAGLASSMLLFVLSLVCSNPLTPGRRFGGWLILLHGWREFRAVGLVGPFVAITWFANVAIPVAWLMLLLRRYSAAVTVGVLGLVLSLAYLLGSRVAVSSGSAPQPIHLGAAYWLWVSSFVVALSAAMVGRRGDSRRA